MRELESSEDRWRAVSAACDSAVRAGWRYLSPLVSELDPGDLPREIAATSAEIETLMTLQRAGQRLTPAQEGRARVIVRRHNAAVDRLEELDGRNTDPTASVARA